MAGGIKIVLKNKAEVTAKALGDIRRLEAQKSITNTRIARFLQAQARLRAPFKTGKLANSIKVRNLKHGNKQVKVTAIGVRSGWRYPNWVNRSPGYEKRFNVIAGRRIEYGDTSLGWNWTGESGFFTKAIDETNKNFKGIALEGYNKALGARVK